MSIKEARNWFIEQGDDVLAAQATVLLQLAEERHGVDDVPPSTPKTIFEASEYEPNSLEDVIQRYREAWEGNSLTPDLVNETWLTFWTVKAQEGGLEQELEVPRCDRTTEELAALKTANRGVLLLPDSVMVQQGIALLGLPTRIKNSLLRTKLTNSSEVGGCISVEMDQESPNKNMTGRELGKKFAEEGREGQRLQTYVVASQFNHLLTDHYFDEQSTSLLLGTRGRANVMTGSARLFTGEWGLSQSQYHGLLGREESFGGRSEGRKRV